MAVLKLGVTLICGPQRKDKKFQKPGRDPGNGGGEPPDSDTCRMWATLVGPLGQAPSGPMEEASELGLGEVMCCGPGSF